jgi:glucan 1,3-beta-glucosidase
MDSYSLCQALGPVEGNKLMRAHWSSFYTEQDIKNLADRGVEILRVPIGDWSLEPYGPYVGCMDGAADMIDWMYDMCEKYGIKILMDVHAVKDS